MDKRKVLMLGAGPLQVPAIQELKKMGVYVVCLDQNPWSPGFLYADETAVISTLDVDAVCREFQKQHADVILTCASDAPVRVISEVSERLGLPGALSYEDACAVTIKNRMRERLKENGIPIPEYLEIHNEEELYHAFYDVFHRKCVIKPADNAGSRGVKLLEGQYTAKALKQEYSACRKYTKTGVLMAEEVMEGPEVSVEALTVKGQTTVLAVTDKIVCERPYFVEIGHVEPSRLPAKVQEQIFIIAKKAVSAMHIQNGPSHTEIIVTEDGPKIVETAARLGGDFITSALVPMSTGVSIVRESLRLSLGEDISLKKKWEKGAAVRFIVSEIEGRLVRAGGMQDILMRKGIREAVLYIKPGDRVRKLRSSSDRIGHIIACENSGEAAWECVQAAYKNTDIVVEGELR